MNFGYEGFTQDNDKRCFIFRGSEGSSSTDVFCLEIDLPLFAQYRILMQEGPMFCLQLLTRASLSEPNFRERFRNYRVLADDFRPVLLEREKRMAETALRKLGRKHFRKPPSMRDFAIAGR